MNNLFQEQFIQFIHICSHQLTTIGQKDFEMRVFEFVKSQMIKESINLKQINIRIEQKT